MSSANGENISGLQKKGASHARKRGRGVQERDDLSSGEWTWGKK